METQYHNEIEAKPPTRANFLKVALDYAERGIPVLPLRDKVPLTPHGVDDATTDRARIHAWANAHPGANIGIATGSASGLVVVDLDEATPEAIQIWDSLPPTPEVATGRGRHRYYRKPPDTEVRSRKLAPGLELQAERRYVVAPPSVHESGARYRWTSDRSEVSLLPDELLEHESTNQSLRQRKGSTVALGTGPISHGERNNTLASIAGSLHDGTRDANQLAADLLRVNEARCEPPLPEPEVRAIARSIYGREPCKPSVQVTPLVAAMVDYLASVERPVKGMAGASGWSIYRAALELARRYGKEHPDGVELSVDVRTWAQVAGTHAATVSRFIKRTNLMRVVRRGSGRRSSAVVLCVPPAIRHYLQHSSSVFLSIEHEPTCSVAGSALLRILERLRWGPGRIGKSRAAILHAMVECGGILSRAEMASRLGRKPESLRAPLKWLVDAGLLERVGHGLYAVAADLATRVEEAREMGREPEADRLQIARHDRERDAYRRRKIVKPTPHLANRKADGVVSELKRVPDPDPDDEIIQSEAEVFEMAREFFGLKQEGAA